MLRLAAEKKVSMCIKVLSAITVYAKYYFSTPVRLCVLMVYIVQFPLLVSQVSRISHRRFFTLQEQLCQAKPRLLRPPPPWPLLPHYLRDPPKFVCHPAETLRFPRLLASHKQLCEPGSLQPISSGGPRVEEEGKKVKARQKGE